VRALPIDTGVMSFAFIDALAVDQFDRERNVRRAGQQAADPDGTPFWNVNLLAVIEGEDGGETMRCKVAASDKPAFSPLDKVELAGLVARPWENNGRSGISFSASAITAAGSTNGRTRSNPLATAESAA
jgi:hypothetical protein